MNSGWRFMFVIVLPIFLFSCQSPPPVAAIGRPEVKIVDYADIQRRYLVPPKTQFARSDTVAVCVQGFAGRTVTMQVWEKSRGLVKTWSQYIAAPDVRRRDTGMTYRDNLGFVQAVPRTYVTQVEYDYVVPLGQPAPGTYEVRAISNEGIVKQASFSVSN